MSKSPSGRLFDENYSGKTAQLHLYLQLSKSHLQAAFFDPIQGKYAGIQNIFLGEHNTWFSAEKEIIGLIGKHFTGPFKKVKIAVSDTVYTSVPKALFSEGALEAYLDFNHEAFLKEEHTILSEVVEAYDLAIVYAVSTKLLEALEKHFSTISWHSHVTPFLEMAAISEQKSNCLLLNIQHLRFDCLYLKEGQLQLLNGFECRNIDDFIYFLLYVMEQMQLSRETSKVILQGEFEEKSELYETLYNYIRHLESASRNENVGYSTVLSSLASPHYKNLFSLHLCE